MVKFMRFLLPLFPLAFAIPAVAQDDSEDILVPESDPGNVLIPKETEESFIPTYSFAGTYGLILNDSEFDGAEGDFSYNEASAWLDAPLYLGDKFKWTLGVRYRYNGLDAGGEAGDLLGGEVDLHRVQLSTNIWWDINEKWNFWGRVSPGLLTDFSNISDDDFGVNVLALGLYTFNDRWKGAIGGFFTSDLGDPILLPAIGVIWTPSKQLSVSLTLPRFQLAYAPNRDWLLTLNGLPGGGGWNVAAGPDSGFDDDLILNYSAIRLSAAVEHRLGGPESKLWGFLELGAQVAQNLEIQNEAEIVQFEEDIDGAFFGAVGMKLRF